MQVYHIRFLQISQLNLTESRDEMGENMPCAKHEAEIKTLFKRIDDMDDIKKVLHNLDKSYALQSQMMGQMVERNDRQDKRMDDQDARMSEYQAVMVKVSTNLTELAEGQKILNQSNRDLGGKVEDLSEEIKDVRQIQEVNEKKYMIHTGELLRDFILKVAIPLGFSGAVIIQIVKMLKG